jgi:hypothetical protein
VPNIIGESTPADGDPSPPNLQTLSVNLTGTIYSRLRPLTPPKGHALTTIMDTQLPTSRYTT